ncbi:conjugal transfer protein [Lachnospiraceae bacterium oral taxon 500]|nr:conjugal transfer protein [Lachnospiraceae bacterium oral taxon 500]
MDKNKVLQSQQSQENRTKEVMSEIKEEYTKTTGFLEENTNQQLNIAKEMKDEMKNKDFDTNIEELKALKEEITGLKAEIKRLNEMENIGLSSLIVRDIKSVGNALMSLQEKAIGSIKHLYDNMKHQLSYNLTKAQEKFVQIKIGIVKGLVNSMQDFIREQQKKLDSCLEKLDNLSKEIQKDEEKLIQDGQNHEDNTRKEDISIKHNEDKQQEEKETTPTENEEKKEISSKEILKAEMADKGIVKREEKEKPKERPAEKKPSVLKKLKENQQKIKKEEKARDVKVPKKDKGMEL